MKRFLLICLLISAISLCLADDQISPGNFHRQGITVPAENLKLPTHSRAGYQFLIPPVSLLTSYWDYQIGGYTSLAARVQSATAGNGVYLSYMGQRTASGQRRVFYTYVTHEGVIEVNNEISSSQVREGYVSHDVDRVSGKPLFAWHVDAEPADAEYEINTAWDAFLEGIPGLISEPTVAINNPISLTINNVNYNDNEFIWPILQIGPSPTPDHRRVYIFTTNSVSHSNPANASENCYYAYADFTPEQLELGEALVWSYGTIPLLDNWNTDQTAWRRFFRTNIVGDDGKVYMMGYHVGQTPDTTPIDEPYLDVLVNTNYGEGEWTQYSINPDIVVQAPDSVFADPDGGFYTSLTYSVVEGTNNSGYVTPDGHLHMPLFFGLVTPANTYYTLMQYMKDIEFDVTNHSFTIHDLYPSGINPNDGVPVMPWDINEDGAYDLTEDGDIALTPTWPFVYWDETADGGNLLFDYNTVKFTKVNEQGMVAAVWSSSLNAKLYNDNPDLYPELAAYAGVPEISISVYPVIGDNGPQWSEPINLNSIENSQLRPEGDAMIPEWVHPGDYIEYLGDTPDGFKTGKLHLMFFDDNTWGSGSITNPIGQNDGGRVMYTALKLIWQPGSPYDGVDDEANSLPPVLMQNYPNPFNPTTTIAYNTVKPGKVALNVYNVKGQLVRNLVNEIKPIGNYQVTWDGISDNGSKVGSGVYFYRFESNGSSMTKKMVLLK